MDTPDEDRYTQAVFLIDVDKIRPNPYQPRRDFNEDRLRDLADSIRMYGVLQPLVVTRHETIKEDGGLIVSYELIAGERRLRASKLAGLFQVPAVIRTGAQTDKAKLEMAIIENLQREDLNPIDRAQAFRQLASEFNLKHAEIGKRVGRSREYVANSVRILALPQDLLDALASGKITEGHTRPLLMLSDRPEEQITLFKEILLKRLNVRESESLARRFAIDKVRKKHEFLEPEILAMEDRLTERYGTRVKVEKKGGEGGRIIIDFAKPEELDKILGLMDLTQQVAQGVSTAEAVEGVVAGELAESKMADDAGASDEDLYSVTNFSL